MNESGQNSSYLHYALFKADPSTEPPFSIELGGSIGIFQLENCAHIPDGLEKINAFAKELRCEFHKEFTFLYPIYMDAMNSDHEGTMHQIAWLIKDAADAAHWGFERIGGLTGKTQLHFLRA